MRSFELTYVAPTEPPKINEKKRPDTFDKIDEYLKSHLGETKIPNPNKNDRKLIADRIYFVSLCNWARRQKLQEGRCIITCSRLENTLLV